MNNEFDLPEITKITLPEVQKQLLTAEIDTDPEFRKSEFWFRFQKLEKEILLLRESFSLIYRAMKMRYIDSGDTDIPDEYLRIIFQIAEGIVDGIPISEFNETT